jgi:hypothetical protein
MLPILLGAAVLFGSSPLGLIDPALGQPKSKTVTYTFQGYCDGIQLTQTGTEASGLHLESGCGEADAFAGGFKGAITGHADTWDISTTDSGAGDLMETYLIDEKSLIWFLYESQDSHAMPFEYIQGGTLVEGYSGDNLRARGALSTSSAYTPRLYTLEKPKRSETVTYTFAGACDGITLTQSGDSATGYHLEGNCSLADAYVGGFKAAIPGASGTWDITGTLTGGADEVDTWLIDENTLTYKFYYSFDSYGTPFRYLASGNLVTGYATHRQGVKNRLPSTWNVRTR